MIEGVGIGIQRMMAENTRLDVRISRLAFLFSRVSVLTGEIVTSSSTGCQSSGGFAESDGRLMGFRFLIFEIYSTLPYLAHFKILGISGNSCTWSTE